jgi:hypothetical protein
MVKVIEAEECSTVYCNRQWVPEGLNSTQLKRTELN